MKNLFWAITVFVLFCACSDNNKKIEAAQLLGEHHAIEILNNELTGKELVARLLEIRALEYELRCEGNDKVADIYIESFTTFILANNQQLASIIFDTDSISITD